MTALLGILLESSIRITAAALLAGMALCLARVRASAVKHAVWTGVLCAMLLMPALPYLVPSLVVRVPARTAIMPTASYDFDAPPGTVVNVAPPAPDAPHAAMPAAPSQSGPVWPIAVSAVWAAGVLFLLARFAAGWHAMRRIVKASSQARADTAIVHESSLVAVPVTVGVISPKILLPSTWRAWPEEKLRAVVAHELAHVRRHDPLTSMLAHLNRCLFWFHPLAWWLERKLALTAEHAADDAGLRAAGDSRKYAELLLDMAETVRRRRGRLAWQGVGVDNPGLLGRRIERILSGGLLRDVSRARRILVGLCCLVAVILVAACRQRSIYTGELRKEPRNAERLAGRKAVADYVKAAREMTPQQAADLETRLRKNPGDLDARKKLMIYYSDRKMLDAFRAQKLWIIGHHPEDELAVQVNPLPDPVGDRQAKTLWLAAIARPDPSVPVLSNAARFFEAYDPPLAERLLLRAQAAEPGRNWTDRLGTLYADVLTLPGADSAFVAQVRKKLAESNDPKLLDATARMLLLRGFWQRQGPVAEADFLDLAKSFAERAMKLDPNQESSRRVVTMIRQADWSRSIPSSVWKAPAESWQQTLSVMPESERFRWSAELATTAYIRGELADNRGDAAAAKANWEWARKYAQEALDLAAKFKNDPNYGTAVYRANMTLGMVAMRVDGNKKAATEYMLEASKVPATDELAYNIEPFTMKLPVALLKYGGLDEREAVIEFLERFGKIARRPDLPLLENAAQLRSGYMPSWYEYQAAKLK